jgi:hypothetical protein
VEDEVRHVAALASRLQLDLLYQLADRTHETERSERSRCPERDDERPPAPRAGLRGHALHRGLLRALTFFTWQHPDAAFVRKAEDLQWQVFRAAADLLLTRRREIRHPDPDAAVPFALLMVGVAAKGVLVLPPDSKHMARLVPNVEARLRTDLPAMIGAYLGLKARARNAGRRASRRRRAREPR